MTRLMSVALTESQVRSRSKTVTRRAGWTFLRAGERLTLCRKVMGRKAGEPLVRIVDVEVTSVRRQRLGDITLADVDREGFTGWSVPDFIAFFTEHMGGTPEQIVTRIEWRYLEAPDG